jgi:hypothetical protein
MERKLERFEMDRVEFKKRARAWTEKSSNTDNNSEISQENENEEDFANDIQSSIIDEFDQNEIRTEPINVKNLPIRKVALKKIHSQEDFSRSHTLEELHKNWNEALKNKELDEELKAEYEVQNS